MPLALEARHHLAQGDGVLDIGLQRVAHRTPGAVKGGLDLQVDHRSGVHGQQHGARAKRQHQKQGDRTDQPELKRHTPNLKEDIYTSGNKPAGW